MKKRPVRLTLESLSERITPAAGILRNSLGQIVITGTAADDTAHASVSGSNMVVELNGTTTLFALSRARSIIFRGLDGNDAFTNDTNRPSIAYGGNGDDRLSGGSAADTFYGGAGNDNLLGNAGNDTLRGDLGDDSIHGGVGNDAIFGGAGNDDLNGDDGNDVLQGEVGDDRLSGGNGNDQAFGGAGNDDLHGDNGNDLIRGGAGDDNLNGGQGNDDLNGELGDDRLVGGLGVDVVRGGAGQNRSVHDSMDRLDDTQASEGTQLSDGLASVEGTITAIDGNTVTVRTAAQVDVQVVVTATSLLEKNGVHVGLNAFSVGDQAEARFDPSNHQVFKLESGEDHGGQTGQGRAEGTITAVTGDGVSITLLSGQVVTVHVNASTTLERNGLHVALTAFQVGDSGEARFDATTLVATQVEAVGT